MRTWLIALAAGLLLSGYVDFITPELTPSLFYAIVVLAASYRFGLPGALASALAASAVHMSGTHESPVQDGFEGGLLLLVGLLGAAMRRQLWQLRASRAQLKRAHAHVLENLEAARRIQAALLESPPSPQHGVEVAASYRMASDLGGDFFFVHTAPTRMIVCLGDVAGKGPPAALVAVAARSLLEEGVYRYHDPATLLGWLESRLVSLLPEGMFVTCFCAFLEDGQLTYANAGHDPPLLRRALTSTLLELPTTGLPLGIQPQQLGLEGVQLESEDRLLLYTDGLERLPDMRGYLRGFLGTSHELARGLLGQLPEKLADDAMVLALRKL